MEKDRQKKREQFNEAEKKNRFGMMVVIAVVVLVAAGSGYWFFSSSGAGAYTSVKSTNGEVRLDLNRVSDGQAHYFRYATSQGDISFFVIKSVDGVMRAAFDACDVCYKEKKGYRQEGDMMVCNNCGMKFRSDLINLVKGGCNPAPLNRSIDGEQLVIRDADIRNGAWYFGS